MKIKTDMPENGWWDKLPKTTHKWIRLGRFDRPIYQPKCIFKMMPAIRKFKIEII